MAFRIDGIDSKALRLKEEIRKNNINEILSLITNDIDVSIVDDLGNNIFHILADIWATKEIAEVLVEKINLDLLELKNEQGDTPIHKLIRHHCPHSIDILKVYIKAKISIIDICNDDGNTPLMMAIDFNCLKIAYCLINNNADIDKINVMRVDNYFHRHTALSIAIHHSSNENHQILAKHLIKKGAKLNIERRQFIRHYMGETLLHVAIKAGNNDIAKMLIKNNINLYIIDSHEKTVFSCAYDNNNGDIIEMLLSKGFSENDIYSDGKTFAENAEYHTEKKQWFLNLIRGNPEQLSKILKKFSNDERLKYTNHPWPDNLGYDKFNLDLVNGWEEIKDELQNLSQTLYENINNFLFNTDGNIGFSSSNITSELKKGVKPDSITKLSESIDKFKQNIVIKPDENYTLVDMFMRVFKKIDLYLDINLVGIENFSTKIFTDIEGLESAIVIILKDTHEKQSDAEIKVTIEDNLDNKELINLKIIHIDSKHKPNSKELLNTIGKTGNFTSINNALKPICYWDVEVECEDGKKRIEYLYPVKDNDKPHLISIPDEIEGFTHILRLYK